MSNELVVLPGTHVPEVAGKKVWIVIERLASFTKLVGLKAHPEDEYMEPLSIRLISTKEFAEGKVDTASMEREIEETALKLFQRGEQ